MPDEQIRAHPGTIDSNDGIVTMSTTTFRLMERRIAVLEQLCKDAAHLMETAPLGAITNSASELDWFARYDRWKQQIEQEVK